MTKDELVDELVLLQDTKQALEYTKNVSRNKRDKILKDLELRKLDQQISQITNRLYILVDNNRESE